MVERVVGHRVCFHFNINTDTLPPLVGHHLQGVLDKEECQGKDS